MTITERGHRTIKSREHTQAFAVDTIKGFPTSALERQHRRRTAGAHERSSSACSTPVSVLTDRLVSNVLSQLPDSAFVVTEYVDHEK